MPQPRLVLASGTWRDLPFGERLAAAASAGITTIGLHHEQYRAALAAGDADDDIKALLDLHGVGIAEVEVLGAVLEPDDAGRTGSFGERLFAMADRFGASRVIAVSQGTDDLAAGVKRFAALCDRAAEHGLSLALEFAPWTVVPDLATAWDVVRRAERPNAGVVLDTWHFFRGRSTIDDLATVPAEAIAEIQISDGPPVTAGVDPYHETRHCRRPPGAGVFDLIGLLRGLDEHGVRAPIAIEVLSDKFAGRDPAEVFGELVATTAGVLDEAGYGQAA
jgi:sugar phosphate isomerase/epimerase